MRKQKGPSLGFMPAFYEAMFSDIANLHSSYEGWAADREYVLSRLTTEGAKFALLVLPKLGKAAERSLITGQAFVCPSEFSVQCNTSLPRFLNFLFRRVFRDDGVPRYSMDAILKSTQDANVSLVTGYDAYKVDMDVYLSCSEYQSIRQVTMAFSKSRFNAPKETVDECLRSFEMRVTSCGIPDSFKDRGYQNAVLREARFVLHRIFPDEATMALKYPFWKDYLSEPWGRHGPGAVAGGEQGRQKWSFGYIPGIYTRLYQWREGTTTLKVVVDPFSRVITVPKDFRGPRIICIEPKEFQFAQQGLMEILYRTIKRDPVLRRCIDMEDVSVSRDLCSRRDICTIDLKDASDLVSLQLVRLLFPPWLFRTLTRYRARGMKMPDGRVIRPSCFATMGSALCFPVETLVFWAIARAAMNLRGHPRDTLRVFGDDIITTERNFSCVSKALTLCGLKINEDKTCAKNFQTGWNSPIRESCGAYTYLLMSCEITRFKTTAIVSTRDYLSGLDYGRELYARCYKEAAKAILAQCDKVFTVPYGRCNVPPIRRSRATCRWSRNLQRTEVLQPVLVQVGPVQPLSDYDRLYAWHVGNSLDPSFRGTRKRVKVKWIPDDACAGSAEILPYDMD